ncbi:GAF domain-containing protein [Beijerinckia sp. L45]|uniref:GAF domain-containing protein n=1 Tax=Beijerinckia sp. L45 TaxID=1641855 RepID=UPI00131CB2AC|nr:GAF domain-containing protein [Beijerinckia sp. L45]
MTSSSTYDPPAFGEADLSNCEREQIHLAGSIQPHGALLVLDDDATTVIQASANAQAFLNLPRDVIGCAIDSFPGTMAMRLRAHLQEPIHRQAVAVRCTIGNPAIEVDGLLHRPADGGVIIELEKAGEPVDLRASIDRASQTILGAPSLRALCDETAALFESIAGYDRVMVYRFDEHGHGQVFSEKKKPELEAFLGNRYPASDIPQIGRVLYLQNRVRVLVDVGYAPVPLVPRLSPITGQDLDMSMCFLRSMSPIHLQYLKNMGVRATLVVSIVVGGQLWGLVACHHYSPRFIHFEVRALCELVAELVATRIAALESFVQAQSELVVRRLEQRMVEAIERDGDWRMALFDGPQTLLKSMGASGAALLYEGQIQTAGDVPGTQQIREIGAWLDSRPREAVMATASLGRDEPTFAPLADVATGVLATPISATPVSNTAGEYLLWFRPERVRTVTWGGDPTKPVIVGTDPVQLSPRLSFAQWHQVVEGTADPWAPADRRTARLISDTVADMVLQFRSVRMLIAQDQLETLSRQVRLSVQPMIVANASGRILLTNEAFEQLLRPGHPSLRRLDDLPQFFSEPLNVRKAIQDLTEQGRTWRGELGLETLSGDVKPLTVRAEPVFATLDRKLGYMVHFTEISERKAAETARRRFQDGMIDRRFVRPAKLDATEDSAFQAMLAPIVENAQLAALEITYGIDTDRMPTMLESIRTSVARTADLLEHLMWHAGTDAGPSIDT